MPKPNHSFSVKEMKDYIRTHKLNKPEIKLSMKRHELIAGLKKIGHWSEQSRKLITNKGRPVPKDSSMKSSRKLITNKGRPTKPPPRKTSGYTGPSYKEGDAGSWVDGKFIKKKSEQKPLKSSEIRRAEPLPVADRKTVIDLRGTDDMIGAYLKKYKFKTKAQETKFNQIYDAYKARKKLGRVDGKSVKYTIKENKVNVKYGYIMVDDMYSDPPKFTDTKSVFIFNSK